MLKMPINTRVYICSNATDMRRQFDGLATLVREGMQREPRSGDLYVFHNKRGDIAKILFFDQQGYCLLAKRLDQGVFAFVKEVDASQTTLEVGPTQLAQLLAGVALKAHHGAPQHASTQNPATLC